MPTRFIMMGYFPLGQCIIDIHQQITPRWIQKRSTSLFMSMCSSDHSTRYTNIQSEPKSLLCVREKNAHGTFHSSVPINVLVTLWIIIRQLTIIPPLCCYAAQNFCRACGRFQMHFTSQAGPTSDVRMAKLPRVVSAEAKRNSTENEINWRFDRRKMPIST